MKFFTKKSWRITVSCVLIFAVLLSIILFGRDKEKISGKSNFENALKYLENSVSDNDYDTYFASNSNVSMVKNPVTVAKNLSVSAGESVTVSFDTSACKGILKFKYNIVSEQDGNGSCSIKINGKLPFREASGIMLFREWLSNEPNSDTRGNEYSVSLTESTEKVVCSLSDATGFHTKPFVFAFKDGKNDLTVISEKGKLQIESIVLEPLSEIPAYSEVLKSYSNTKHTNNEVITVEAEMPYLRTNASISELCDRTSPVTTPKFDGQQVWNSLGGSGWSTSGQYASWKINVKKSGCYMISLRFKQNFKSGVSCYRRLLIDGSVPFAEMESVRFPYKSGWQTMLLSSEEDEPYLFSLDAGEHIITLEVTLGNQVEAINIAQKSLNKLNGVYRSILMLTGSSPDKYRDYQIEKKLPEVFVELKRQKSVLADILEWLRVNNGGKGEGTAIIEEIIWQMNEFIKYPETLPQSLSKFSSDLSSLSEWIQDCTSQPLIIDSLEFTASENGIKQSEAGFFKKLLYNTKLFFKSYSKDYGVIGDVYSDNAIEAWITLGRDQYQILKEQIDNDFTPNYNVNVNFKLVSGGILEATVAGLQPDVYLFADAGMPVNFASRGALLDLSKFSDYKQVASRFAPNALVPFTYDGGVYGIPITQSFDVLFVRDDILKEIGLKVPETWDDVFNMLVILQQNNMEFAFPVPSNASVGSFALFLFQKQTNFYKDNGKSVAIDTEDAISAFEKWTKLYSEYSSLMSYSFVNRFRVGEMPIGIVDYSTFNTLEVSAPEISGLWSMHPVPGTVNEDGSVKNISVSSSTAAIILKDTEHEDEAWKFVNWFTSAEQQHNYAVAIENKQGISGRFSTANIEAFNRLSWSDDTLQTLNAQREDAIAVEQVPGGYFLARHIDNIFRKVINKDANVRETVLEYSKIINNELTKKRKEFGLEVSK